MNFRGAAMLVLSALALAAAPEGRAALAFRARQDPPKATDTFTLAARYRKGDKIASDAKTKLEMNLKMKGAEGGPVGDIDMDMEIEAREKYATQVLGVTDKGEIEKELREYTLAESKQKVNFAMDDMEHEQPEEKRTLPLEGKTFEITRTEDGAKVVLKGGDDKELPKSMYRLLRSHQAMEAVLPDKAVAKGDRWTVDGKKLKAWFEQLVPEVRLKSVSGTIECTLKEVAAVDGKRIATIAMTIDVEGTTDMATMRAAGADEEEDEDEGPSSKGEMTFKIQKGKGEYRFNIDDGLPMKAEMSSNFEFDVTQEMGESEMTGKGKGKIEASSEWKLEERPQ